MLNGEDEGYCGRCRRMVALLPTGVLEGHWTYGRDSMDAEGRSQRCRGSLSVPIPGIRAGDEDPDAWAPRGQVLPLGNRHLDRAPLVEPKPSVLPPSFHFSLTEFLGLGRSG